MDPKPVVDYDRTSIPDGYDRAREHGPEFLALWMRTVMAATHGHGAVSTILDLGCGTGRFSHGLADTFSASVIGLDPSTKMIMQAWSKPRHAHVHYAIARGEDIPLPDSSVDLVFLSMVFHHFARPERVTSECRRVVRAGGAVFLRAGTRDRIDGYPYIPFFPSSVPLLHQTLPSCAVVRQAFEASRLRVLVQGVLVQQIAATHADYADKLEAGGDSVLARLEPGDFRAGLASLRAHARSVDPRPVTEPIDYFVFD
jgi:ubiquinone/menaquinone biosynthesis C-methylase UbiE